MRDDFFGYSKKFAEKMGKMLRSRVVATLNSAPSLNIFELEQKSEFSRCIACKHLSTAEVPLQEIIGEFIEEVCSKETLSPSATEILVKTLEFEIKLERDTRGDDDFIFSVLTKQNIFKGG